MTAPAPTRCARCQHGPSTHTGGHGRCWQTPCCCEKYVDPAETPIPARFDGGPSIREYLESKGEL